MNGKKIFILSFILAAFLLAAALLTVLYGFGERFISKGVDDILGTPSYPAVKSSVDKDGDGIDDQTDVLQGVKDYIATEPQYKSIYYAGGYPDDDHGVCTDVVAFGLLAAGYDLRELIDEDIKKDPSAYGMRPGERDSNIDFRRVRNQKVWFRRHAVSLTLDLSDPEDWQGGDIIVYEGHVAVLSDRRNHKGLPYKIHLYSRAQTAARNYEQNSLEKNAENIIGHYRISE